MTYIGDFSTGSTLNHLFTTVGSSGAPTALSSAGALVYADGSTVEATTGVSLTASFASRTGLNLLTVSMEAASTFFLPGQSYTAVISSGAVGSDSIAGYTICNWSVKDRNNIASVTSAVSISTASVIDSVTTVTGNVTGSIGSLTTAAAVQVNAEVSDVLTVDTISEPAAGTPTETPTIASGLGRLYHTLVHQIVVASSAKVFYDSSGNVLWGKVLSQDSTGSTGVYTEADASTST